MCSVGTEEVVGIEARIRLHPGRITMGMHKYISKTPLLFKIIKKIVERINMYDIIDYI